MIDEETFEQGRDPEVLLLVHGYCQHGGVVDDAVQVVVAAAELLLVIIVGEKPFVVSTQPYILPRVLKHLCHHGVRYRPCEVSISLTMQ